MEAAGGGRGNMVKPRAKAATAKTDVFSALRAHDRFVPVRQRGHECCGNRTRAHGHPTQQTFLHVASGIGAATIRANQIAPWFVGQISNNRIAEPELLRHRSPARNPIQGALG